MRNRVSLLENLFQDLGLYSPAKHSSDFIRPKWQGNFRQGNKPLSFSLETAKNR